MNRIDDTIAKHALIAVSPMEIQQEIVHIRVTSSRGDTSVGILRALPQLHDKVPCSV